MFQPNYKQQLDNGKNQFVISCSERLKNDHVFSRKLSNYEQNELLEENIDENAYFEICKRITSWDVDEYLMSQKDYSPKYSLVLLTISHISFNRLTQLNLTNCGIQNIQSITWLYAPNLMALNLSGNHVRQLNSLNHCHYKKLSNINIQSKGNSNFFISNISRMKTCDQIKLLHINNETVISSSQYNKFPNYLTALLKMESSKIKRLGFQITKKQYQTNRYYFNKINQQFMNKRGIKNFQIFKEQNKVIQYRARQQKQ